jgi:hypothetical protein
VKAKGKGKGSGEGKEGKRRKKRRKKSEKKKRERGRVRLIKDHVTHHPSIRNTDTRHGHWHGAYKKKNKKKETL